ncbi:putative polygalacturonase A precursor [Penicillium brasilianum]|uniref:Pectinase D n=1 Tax=Penicillium brasilianum TaxID=104259 RepID=A0A1S9S139_PENBI|nr:putative polygalacturonase A precursor [Penicillium brasilianum]
MLGTIYLALAASLAVSHALPGASAAHKTCSDPWARVSPAKGAVVVDNSAKPYPGSFSTVQAGVDALSTTTTTPQSLFVFPGTYVEQVYIPRLASNLTVQGYTCNSKGYEDNTATITYNLALINTTSDDLTATLRQWNPNTKVYNMNIVNTFGHIPKNGQNLAVSAETTGQGYYGCQLIGYQDTLLAETGSQLYAKSLIVGAVDFIFGQTALAWLEGIDIRTIATGCITASGRSSASNPSWYVISRSSVSGINDTISAGTNYLGRPWGSFARVVFQETYLGNVIAAAGWKEWSTTTPNTGDVTFAEYNNYGPGSVLQEGPRANFSEQLTASISIQSILGENFKNEWWIDTSYLDPSDLKVTKTHTTTSVGTTSATKSSGSTATTATTAAGSVTTVSNSASAASSSAVGTLTTSSTTSTVLMTSAVASSSLAASLTASSATSSATSGTPCVCADYSEISAAVASCTNIVLSNIAAPNGSAIDLSGLQAGTTVTFDGLTTFGFTNSSSFDPITIGGAGITITANPGAVIDGNGQAYWDGLGSNGGVPKPNHFIVVKKVTGNSVIKDLYIQNWPVHLFSISSCSDLVFQDLVLNNTAGNAPNSRSGTLAAAHNSDGFDVSSSTNIVIERSVVWNQDDCVAITSGNNMTVSNLECHGGHGLSIGSVGLKSNNNVTNILFTDSSVFDSQNGCRIKTNYNATGFVANITYSNIALQDISIYGIDVQQDYLNGGPTGNPSNGVLIEGLLFQNVTGTATSTAQDYYILCGDGSCSDFTFTDVSITGGSVTSSCNYPASGCPS